MPVARARSRVVKLILPMASTIGRASKLVMSICSTGVDSRSALRLSLIRSASWTLFSVSVCMVTSSFPRKRESRYSRWSRKTKRDSRLHGDDEIAGLKLHHVRATDLDGRVEAGHRLVLDDRGFGHSEAVELRA